MSANIETLFYAGRCVPWHGLGTQVDEAPTSEHALELAGLNWTVESRPVFTESGIEIPNYKANIRSSDNSVLGIVTDRYKIVQNAEAFDFTDSLINEGEVRYETAGSLRNGKTIWLLAKMPEAKVLNEKFEPYICFTNSHDGTGAIRVCMTPVRVVCNNTLNFALDTAKRIWSTKHIGDLSSKLDVARETLELANNYMAALDEKAYRLADIKLDDGQIDNILSELFPVSEEDSDIKKKRAKDAKENIMVCYFMPDIAQFKGTGYGLVNAVADFVDHAAPMRMTQNYQANNWDRIMIGHPILDKAMQLVSAVSAG